MGKCLGHDLQEIIVRSFRIKFWSNLAEFMESVERNGWKVVVFTMEIRT